MGLCGGTTGTVSAIGARGCGAGRGCLWGGPSLYCRCPRVSRTLICAVATPAAAMAATMAARLAVLSGSLGVVLSAAAGAGWETSAAGGAVAGVSSALVKPKMAAQTPAAAAVPSTSPSRWRSGSRRRGASPFWISKTVTSTDRPSALVLLIKSCAMAGPASAWSRSISARGWVTEPTASTTLPMCTRSEGLGSAVKTKTCRPRSSLSSPGWFRLTHVPSGR